MPSPSVTIPTVVDPREVNPTARGILGRDAVEDPAAAMPQERSFT